MRYLGGKSRIRKEIADVLNNSLRGREYLEPFVGAGWVLQEVRADVRYASDSNFALITMYEELLNGWIPPEFVSEEEYYRYKEIQDEYDPMTAFVGIGCSYSGKWFGGYARSGNRNYAANARNSLLKQLPLIKSVRFEYRDYRDWNPEDMLVYCDPPYANTTRYKEEFDSDEFWSVMREWSKRNTVFISEYTAPDDFLVFREIRTKTDMRVGGMKEDRVEKLFLHYA
jgi:DNA adenine methylase